MSGSVIYPSTSNFQKAKPLSQLEAHSLKLISTVIPESLPNVPRARRPEHPGWQCRGRLHVGEGTKMSTLGPQKHWALLPTSDPLVPQLQVFCLFLLDKVGYVQHKVNPVPYLSL